MGNVNVLDVLSYTILNGGSQYLNDEDVWFWDEHLSKPHITGNVAYVPQYSINQIDATFRELNTSAISENLTQQTNEYYMTSDYLKGTFLFSKTTKNLYYLDIPQATVEELPKAGTLPTVIGGSAIGKLLEYRPVSNWLFFANTGDETLYKYDVAGSQWTSIALFPTGWQINSVIDKEVTLLVDQVTNDLYMMTRNLYVISTSNKTIYYNYRVFRYDMTGGIWSEVIPATTLDLYQYGFNTAESPQSPGRCMIHNGKLYVFNIFSEVFPNNTKGRVTYLSYIIVDIATKGVEKSEWIPIFQQNINCTLPLQALRYGNYMALITPQCPNASILVNPANNKLTYLRTMIGAAQGTNTIRSSSVYSLSAVPSSQMLYDPRERKEYPLSWTQGTLITDYSFEDQIYTETIEIYCTSQQGLTVYADLGTGSFTSTTLNFNAQSNIATVTLNTYLKRFRISYAISSQNAMAELYKIKVMANNTHVKIQNAAGTSYLTDDTFSNIVVGTPTAPRLYKVVNQTGVRTTAVRVYIEADGDTGSYFTEVSSQSDTGYVRHCTANSGTACTKGFDFGSRDCANGRCGGFEKATLLPTPQSLAPGGTAAFYVRVNVPVGQTRINRQARVIAQLEY
jgi:hypothetical protein